MSTTYKPDEIAFAGGIRCLLFSAIASISIHFALLAPANAGETINIGLVPSEDAEAMAAQSRPLLEALKQNTGYDFKPFVATDYGGVIEAMRSKHVDVAWFGGFSYVLAAELAGAEAFAVPVPAKTGISAYSSCIFVRADSPYKSLDHLKGKTFALVDPSSTSGNMFPRALLKMHGIEEAEKYFSRVIYSGSHNASLLALKNSKIDAVGSNPEISLNNMIRNNQIGADELRKVLCSDPIPNSPFAIRNDLPDQQAEKIKAAFYQIKDLTFAEYGKLDAFKKAHDADYDIIRDVAKLMDLDLKK